MNTVTIKVQKDGSSSQRPWTVTLLTDDDFKIHSYGYSTKKSAIINQVATWVSQCANSTIKFEGINELEYKKTMLNHQLEEEHALAEFKRNWEAA